MLMHVKVALLFMELTENIGQIPDNCTKWKGNNNEYKK